MNTKKVPAIVSLMAGLIATIVTTIRRAELIEVLTTLLLVLLSFYILGCIIKVILDKFVSEDEEGEGEDEEVELENIDMDERKEAEVQEE